MHTVIVATRNAHKTEEIQSILGHQFRCLNMHSFPGAPEVVEDANSFAGNATKKAVEIACWLSRVPENFPFPFKDAWVLADDSGLEVDALNGAPGILSARFAAEGAGNSSDAANNAKLLQLLSDVPLQNRAARFRCVLALTPLMLPLVESASPVCMADERELATEIFEGACEGSIQFSPSGSGGFGYDPLFRPTGYSQSFAELGEPVKNRISHRAKALEALKKRWRNEPDLFGGQTH